MNPILLNIVEITAIIIVIFAFVILISREKKVPTLKNIGKSPIPLNSTCCNAKVLSKMPQKGGVAMAFCSDCGKKCLTYPPLLHHNP